MTTFSLPHFEPPTEPDPLPSPDEERAIVESLREQARAEGFEAGRQEGLTQLREAVGFLQMLSAEMSEQQGALCDAVEPAAVALALAAADQVVGAALAVQPELVENTLERALRRLVDRERVIVMVNPEELARLRDRVPEIAAELGGIEHIEVQADRRIAPGGLVVQTPTGDVDARLDTRVMRLSDVVREALVG